MDARTDGSRCGLRFGGGAVDDVDDPSVIRASIADMFDPLREHVTVPVELIHPLHVLKAVTLAARFATELGVEMPHVTFVAQSRGRVGRHDGRRAEADARGDLRQRDRDGRRG